MERPLSTAESNVNSRPLVHVHLYYGKDADGYRQSYLSGREPDESPYGFHLAVNEGFDVSFSKDLPRSRSAVAIRLCQKVLRLDLVHAYANRQRIRKADIVWTMTETEAFAVAFLNIVGLLPRKPIVANAIRLFDYWAGLGSLRRTCYRRLARHINILTVHSETCLDIAREEIPGVTVEFVHFGINTNMFAITAPVDKPDPKLIRIYAPGNDRTRDWQVLLDAFGNDEQFEIVIACQWVGDDIATRYSNLTIARSRIMADLLAEYRNADVVAVPMKENVYSGITVALEAVAMGIPLLATRTGGVPSYFDEDQVLYSAPGDSAAMRASLLSSDATSRRIRAECAQQRFVNRNYSTQAVIGRYAEMSRNILD